LLRIDPLFAVEKSFLIDLPFEAAIFFFLQSGL